MCRLGHRTGPSVGVGAVDDGPELGNGVLFGTVDSSNDARYPTKLIVSTNTVQDSDGDEFAVDHVVDII
jgi:hypothetical protein